MQCISVFLIDDESLKITDKIHWKQSDGSDTLTCNESIEKLVLTKLEIGTDFSIMNQTQHKPLPRFQINKLFASVWGQWFLYPFKLPFAESMVLFCLK